ncbi:helix-turn-helix domain-containing protein [Nocardia sp. NPDC127526]|uniref:helix-turn-helix domain-containing protein n=1 Tax=Nocardia sp. NPDC127526 TaxID=3345393 RepID=UPI00363980F3
MNDESERDHEPLTLEEYCRENPDLEPWNPDWWANLRDPFDRWAAATMISLERHERDVTQAQLAERSGVSLRTVKYAEAGEGSPPKASTLYKMWQALTSERVDPQVAAAHAVRDGIGAINSMDVLTNVIGPMYTALTPQQQAEALRRIVLLLNEIKEQAPK